MARTPTSAPEHLPDRASLEARIRQIADLSTDELRSHWRKTFHTNSPTSLSRDLLARSIGYRIQEQGLGGLHRNFCDLLARLAKGQSAPVRRLKPGTTIVRAHGGILHEVVVIPDGFLWQGSVYTSLSAIAKAITGTAWNGPRFFALRNKAAASPSSKICKPVQP